MSQGCMPAVKGCMPVCHLNFKTCVVPISGS